MFIDDSFEIDILNSNVDMLISCYSQLKALEDSYQEFGLVTPAMIKNKLEKIKTEIIAIVKAKAQADMISLSTV